MRIPLLDMIDSLTTSEGERYTMIALPGPVYFVEIDGEVNAVYGMSPMVPINLSTEDFMQTLKKHKIPKNWRKPWPGK